MESLEKLHAPRRFTRYACDGPIGLGPLLQKMSGNLWLALSDSTKQSISKSLLRYVLALRILNDFVPIRQSASLDEGVLSIGS